MSDSNKWCDGHILAPFHMQACTLDLHESNPAIDPGIFLGKLILRMSVSCIFKCMRACTPQSIILGLRMSSFAIFLALAVLYSNLMQQLHGIIYLIIVFHFTEALKWKAHVSACTIYVVVADMHVLVKE